MKELSDMENRVAEQYCHGLTDKEIAYELDKPIWTVRTHKKHIYRKLSIATTHELVLYMVARFLGKEYNAREVRQKGLAAFMLMLMAFHIMVVDSDKYVYRRGRRVVIEYSYRGKEYGDGEEL